MNRTSLNVKIQITKLLDNGKFLEGHDMIFEGSARPQKETGRARKWSNGLSTSGLGTKIYSDGF